MKLEFKWQNRNSEDGSEILMLKFRNRNQNRYSEVEIETEILILTYETKSWKIETWKFRRN
jgi:hypothetical protein